MSDSPRQDSDPCKRPSVGGEEARAQEQADFPEAVLNALPGFVFVFDDDNELVWWNQHLQNVTGYSAQALCGMPPSALFAETDVSAVRQVLRAVRAGEPSTAVEATLTTEQGEAVACEFTGKSLPDEAPQEGWVVGVGREVAMLDVEDQELRSERNRLAALYAGFPSPVVHYKVRNGEAIVQGVNVAFEEVFGVTEEALTGQNLDVFVAPDGQADQAETLTRRAVEEGSVQAKVMRETGDGAQHFQVDSVLFSGGEQPEGYAIYTDVTEQKEREQTLREEQDALRAMYRITADQEASFEEKIQRLIDLGCEYLSLPYGFLTRLSDETQQIVQATGTHPLLQPGSSCPLSESYCRRTIQEDGLLAVQDAVDEGWEGDSAYETFGLGTYIGAQILVEGELYGTFCFAASEARDESFSERERTFVELMTRWVCYEIERRRTTERLERQNERLDNFAGLVAHDLRNPLNVAKGRLELAKDEEDPSHLSAIERALDRMDQIIEDLLALTWGGQDLDPDDLEYCDLTLLARTCWEHVELPQGHLEIDDIPLVHADERRLQRLLENLFRNAGEHGGDDVTLRVGALDDGFFVEDDGPGIPPERRKKVFKAGYSSDEEGTGLGLSIVKTIVDAHGWSLSLKDGRDGGARFEITGVDMAS